MTPLYVIYYKYKGEIKKIQVKDESKNLSGSIKIRPARRIIEEAIESEKLKKGQSICEVTSGNMGIALATLAKQYDYEAVIVMPEFMSEERKNILTQLGAKLILTKTFDEAFAIANSLEKEGAYLTKQFENINNALSYLDLCYELEQQINHFPAFIAGVGTGGTLNGVGRYLKERYNTQVLAIEPLQTLILSTGVSHGHHRIEGLSDGFVPDLYPKDIVSNIISVDDNDAICMSKKLNKYLGLNVGISSGANFVGSIIANIDNIITVFPDDDSKYYSTDLHQKELNSDLVDQIELLYYEKKELL